MNLESITTSLEMSQKLDKAGFKVDTCFWWKVMPKIKENEIRIYRKWEAEINTEYHKGRRYYLDAVNIPAYTFQQLWSALTELKIVEYTMHYWHLDAGLGIYLLDDFSSISKRFEGDHHIPFNPSRHLPDSAGEAVLWCIKNNYISEEDDE